MRTDPTSVSVRPTDLIRVVMEQLNESLLGIALVVDGENRLMGTVTDGDIRRALLKGLTLDTPIREAMRQNPVVAPDNLPAMALMALMKANVIRHLPIVDDAGHLVAMEYLDVPSASEGRETPTAVVMAGGKGERLRPLTGDLPKPMLPIGNRPILEIILESLQKVGFRRILISIGYLRQAIQDHFGDGASFGLDIHYLVESEPLGTAGALSLIPEDLRPTLPFLVINGDLLTRLNFAAFRDFHVAANYEFTLCCRPYEVTIPFGYPVFDGDLVTEFREKPTFHHLVNSGIYCLSPVLLQEVPSGKAYNMPDLIHKLCVTRRRVGVFPLREPFHEIGRADSYHEAEAFYKAHFETSR